MGPSGRVSLGAEVSSAHLRQRPRVLGQPPGGACATHIRPAWCLITCRRLCPSLVPTLEVRLEQGHGGFCPAGVVAGEEPVREEEVGVSSDGGRGQPGPSAPRACEEVSAGDAAHPLR